MDSKKLAVIHIAKSELGMSEGAYRSLLWKTCGVRSAKDLRTGEAFKAVMLEFDRLGYRSSVGRYAGGHGAQWAKARAVWGELYRLGAVRVKSDQALERFARKIDGAGTSAGLSRVIEHLKKWHERVSGADVHGQRGR